MREKNAGVGTPAALILSWVRREVNRTIKRQTFIA
jgi:hypothetical protein